MQDSAIETNRNAVAGAPQSEEAMQQVPAVLSPPVLCCYVNPSKRIQVVRLSHLSEGEWEHILFPAQQFMFEAPPEAMLEVYKSPTLSVTPPEYIPCHGLRVQTD
ncbi:DUF1830 domain-containing protein [Altericista sp. CCNU0014]|uniref:DUF1830 domain-containing protein n=1 Tax=Altericista sp. CCNU0014 TaxID=3082949 RepID=UPI00384C2223